MRKKDITLALILILIAVYLIVSRLHLMPKLPVFTILFTVLFLYAAFRGFMRRHFFEAMVSLGIVGCINDNLLGIEELTPWTLMAAAVLIGIALDMIFKDKKKDVYIESNPYRDNHNNGRVENGADGEFVKVENSFGTVSKYVNSGCLREARIENSFGTCNIFFDNAILGNARAQIKVENSFGTTNIYLPCIWRVNVSQETALGAVKFRGSGSSAQDAPTVDLRLECSFGEIMVVFE